MPDHDSAPLADAVPRDNALPHESPASESPAGGSRLVSLFALPNLPEIHPGDDLALFIVRALRETNISLRDGDIVAIASKVVAKAEGRFVPLGTRADREGLVLEQSRRVVAERRTGSGVTQIVESAAGPVMAAAGIDTSNVPEGQALLLPVDSDRSAEALRSALTERLGVELGVLITDTSSRPWRLGVSDFALGAAGFAVVDDLRGRKDALGSELKVTVRALADEIASAADLVKEKSRGLPVALVRGLGALVTGARTPESGPRGAGDLVRADALDWFRLGHVEAVRASLGVPTGAVDPPPANAEEDDVLGRVTRAVRVAASGTTPVPGTGAWQMRPRAGGAVIRVSPVEDVRRALGPTDDGAHPLMLATLGLGALLQRLESALWAEDLTGTPQFAWGADGRIEHVEVQLATRRRS